MTISSLAKNKLENIIDDLMTEDSLDEEDIIDTVKSIIEDVKAKKKKKKDEKDDDNTTTFGLGTGFGMFGSFGSGSHGGFGGGKFGGGGGSA